MTSTQETASISPVRRFYRDAVRMLFGPGEFYAAVATDRDIGDAFTFICLTSIFYSLAAVFFVRDQQVLLFPLFLANGLLLPVLMAGLLLPLLYLAGSTISGYGNVLKITAYANTALLLAWIPGMAPFAEVHRYILIGMGAAGTGKISVVMAFLTTVFLIFLMFLGIQAVSWLIAR
jgi:hypothetical protein